ncbi:hypothetical protein [Methylocella sp.]|uniref:hypothetical protein n=1 Tax=Methylocella sp. TaxID=1978226 RepID=UPI003784E8F7
MGRRTFDLNLLRVFEAALRRKSVVGASRDGLERLDAAMTARSFAPAGALRRRIELAAERDEHELLVLRFPSEMCKDHGRSINLPEEDSPESLVGAPRRLYEVWKRKFQDLGYGLKALIIDWPHGLPDDVGLFLKWRS